MRCRLVIIVASSVSLFVGCGDDGGHDGQSEADAAQESALDPGTDDADGDEADGLLEADGETAGHDDDGDTYPESVDCDDHDADVIPGSRRPCTSDCGTGTERCEAGAWVGCTAPTDCACDPPGRTRVVDCGNCGIASQRCGDDGIWEMPGECMDEGECAEGEVETESCGTCGTRSRICDATCAWRPWGDCVEHGECARGAVEIVRTACPAGQIQQRRCDDTCSWVVEVPCTNDCILAPRLGSYEEEVCIPGGPFMMGSEETNPTYFDRVPVHEVILSPYLIDKFKVTNRRYRACVEAGTCTAPRDTDATYYRIDRATYDPFPVTNVNREDSATFCAWDGGRLLPTEAQWEKAARGPSPRTVRYPWGDDPDYCSYVNHERCGTGSIVAVDAYPANTSYYGVRGMLANTTEWARDWYDAGYYAVSPSLDPEGPPSARFYSIRSCTLRNPVESDGRYWALTRRGLGDVAAPGSDWLGFRCDRQPWSE